MSVEIQGDYGMPVNLAIKCPTSRESVNFLIHLHNFHSTVPKLLHILPIITL